MEDRNMKPIRQIFTVAKESKSRHQKLVQKLESLKSEMPDDAFFEELFACIRVIFSADPKGSRAEAERAVQFLVRFCIIRRTTPNELEDDTDQFLKRVLHRVLQYHDVDGVNQRYWCCKFVTMLLNEMADEGIDDEMWKEIQNAMLTALQDMKWQIRLHAVTALTRLQEPASIKCPVIAAFSKCFNDPHEAVRRTVIDNIGLNCAVLPLIVRHLRDVDERVRAVAFRKCSTINPEYLKIATRQEVVRCGFAESHPKVKCIFLKKLLPKWLETYDGDVVRFFEKLRLDGDDEDLEGTVKLYGNVVRALCRNSALGDLIGWLKLNEKKLLREGEGSFEAVALWNLFSKELKKMEDGDDYLEEILPDLVDLCGYIKEVAEQKSSTKMEVHEHLLYEYKLYLLFDMIEEYDHSDQVSRDALCCLIVDLLTLHIFPERIVYKMISILATLHSSDINRLIEEICHLVSEIREPLVEVVTDDQRREYDFKVAHLGVRCNVLKEDLKAALEQHRYIEAHSLNKEIEEVQSELDTLKSKPPRGKDRTAGDETTVTARCLDLLIALLQQPQVTVMTPFLQSCKDKFVMPLMSQGNGNVEVFWRTLKVIVLMCLIDKEMAVENCRRIFGVVAFYKQSEYVEKKSLLVAIEGISDLIRLYGPDILDMDITCTDNSSSGESTVRKRRLYNADQDIDFETEQLTFKDILDFFADMMDDECPKLRLKSGMALLRLLLHGLCSSPLLISRLILKWHTSEQDTKLQQLLGVALLTYASDVEGSEDALEKAVIPTLLSIAHAPVSSPLIDVDLDAVIRYLGMITSVKTKQSVVVCSHKNIVQTIVYTINKDPEDLSIPLLIKMLAQLDLSTLDAVSRREIILQTQAILQVIKDKLSHRHLQKFLDKLKAQETCDNNGLDTIAEKSEETEDAADHVILNTEDLNKTKNTASSVKRRRRPKLRKSNGTQNSELVTLDDEVPSSRSGESNTILETTDSESSQQGSVRRSKRKKN